MISANRDKDPKNNLTYLELASLLGVRSSLERVI